MPSSPPSLPPSIVLEVLKILEGEINLREETRVAEQAKPAEEVDKYGAEAARLSTTQHALQDCVVAVVGRIRELPDAESDFAKDLALLAQVNDVMKDATSILAGPETGAPAIAAENGITPPFDCIRKRCCVPTPARSRPSLRWPI